MDAVTTVPHPINEPVKDYAPGSVERDELSSAVKELWGTTTDIPCVIGGKDVEGSGGSGTVVAPFEHSHVLGNYSAAGADNARDALTACSDAAAQWAALPYDERASVFLKAADLLAGPWRARLNAATMLGQAKTVVQAEIDAACELIDFWRFNVHYGQEILGHQPMANAPGIWNRTEQRPLEGFVYAITPFNFTAIGANLPTAAALMGNVVVWKPSPTQALSAHFTMEILREAGLPDGVINVLHGDGIAVSDVALNSEDLAGIHFTGSTKTFQYLWKTVGTNIEKYRSYPRIVGETGGKDFVFAHTSADVDALRIALVRGAFEYQGQKCSAASRAYIPRSVWDKLRPSLIELTESLTMGPTTDFSNFMSAVIDDRSFAKLKGAIDKANASDKVEVIAGGTYDDSEGYYVRPTIAVCEDPKDEAMLTEFFGPLLAIYVYDDADYEATLEMAATHSRYALTGSIVARDRYAINTAMKALRFAAGNFYINDKPTGAVVGQQPFGGGRASGTNDKAGAAANLMRWSSTRSIKETFVSPTGHTYPHMG